MSAGADHTERLKKALVALQKMQERVDTLESAANEPIAVVGIGCRFPGGANGPDAFWRLLQQGFDAVTEIPASRWSLDEWFDPDPERPGKMYARHAALVHDIDRFDAHFFGMAPREAIKTDPQHRLLLEVAWEALEHAGVAPDRMTGSSTGVFVGITVSDYESILHAAGAEIIDAYHMTGSCLNFAAGRLAYTLGLQGPTMAIDSACSSSLVAVHLACRSLQSHECSTALAGGVNAILSPERTVTACKARMLSTTGRPRTFDAGADGFVRGEGCGVIVLRRLRDAIANADTIWAVIRGSAVNQDGPSSGLTVPNRHAQEQVIREALARARVTAADIDYVEAHGTATPLGDPIEVRALGAVLGQGRSPQRPFLLGSVKTNIGHLESAAGIAGLIKAILAVRHGAVPPHLHLETPNPRVEWSEIPARIPTTLTPWPAVDHRRLAGVSSFGGSGTNAHVVLEEPPAAAASSQTIVEGPLTLPLSARAPEALREAAAAWRDALRQESVSAVDLCFTAAHGRAHQEYRFAAVGDSPAALADACDAFVSGQTCWNVVSGRRRRAQERPVFVFSGQGPQWWAMGRELLSHDLVCRRTIEQISEILAPLAGWSLLAELTASETASRLAHTEVAQPALFALQTALAEVWKHWGVSPVAVVGHSVGEIAAAHVAGVLDLESAVRVAFHRGRLMQRATGLGRMAAAALTRADAEQLTARFDGSLSVAAVNGPASVTLAGTATAIESAIEELTRRGVYSRLLQVDYAFHTEQMAPHAAALVTALGDLHVHPAAVPLMSTVTGKEAGPEEFTARYWGRNVRQPVLFGSAIAELAARGHSIFVEIGPHPVLTSSIEQSAEETQPVVAASLVRGRPERASLLAAAGALYSAGCVVDWTQISPHGRRVPAPTYRWQHERYWVEPRHPSAAALPANDSLNPTPVRSPFVQGHVLEWEIAGDRPSYLADHRIHNRTVLPATVFIDMALSGAARVFDGAPTELVDLVILSPMVLEGAPSRAVQLQIGTPTDGRARFSLMSADRATDGAWTLHVEGTAARAIPSPAATLQAEQVKAACDEHFTAAKHYQSLDDRGLSFGERFQTVDAIWRRDGEALADVRLGQTTGTSVHGLHPVLVDGCIQALWAAIPRNERSVANDAWVPVGCGTLRYHCASKPDRVISHVRVVGSADSDTWAADLTIALPDGAVVASLTGIRIQRVRENSVLGSAAATRPADWWHRVEWIPTPAEGSPRPLGGRWIAFDDDSEDAVALTSAIAAEDGEVIRVRSGPTYGRSVDGTYTVDPSNVTDFQRLLSDVTAHGPLRGALHLWSLFPSDATSAEFLTQQRRVCGSLLHYIKASGSLTRPAAETLILVTRGASPAADAHVEPTQAPAWGLMAVAAAEHPELGIRCIDLDPAAAFDAQLLVAELRAPTANQQVALRQSGRYAARLRKIAVPERPADMATRLEIPHRGTLKNLTLVPIARRSPGPGEIEIRVQASGVNFRDVLNTLGMYPGEAGLLGSECVGEITRVGQGVQGLAPGDRVIAVAQGAFSSYVTTLAALSARAPLGMSTDEVATLPITFLTAHCALNELAHMKRGDRVLIHAAAGGVGLAAIQIAQRAGAEIFATAGSAEKHAHLRSLGVIHIMSSRSLDFCDQVMAATGGRGVDIVLNSLAGEFIPKSLAALAANGRFVELGKTDIWNAAQIAAVRPDVSYHAFYLGERLDADPSFGNQMLRALVADVESGALTPLPLRSFPISQAAAAFRYMAQARHIGKVVLRQPRDQADGGAQIRPGGEYLITGGLGALGLAIAEGLAERGARHLTLVGRKAPSADAAARIARLESNGMHVRSESADIADASAVAAVLHQIDASGVPLVGIVHAAGVLEDGALMQQTWERFETVLTPKALGAWHLHRASVQRPLDFFVLFSSMSSVIGSPGQGNYAAANAFLDALAHARRAEGLPASSINWGPWSTAGMAAELGSRRRDQWRTQGVAAIPVDTGVSLFFDLLRETDAQTAILPIDWRAFGTARRGTDVPSLLSDVIPRTTPREAASSAPQSWKDRLLRIAPTQRLDSLMKLVADETYSVLGLPKGFVLDYQQGLREVGLDSLMAVELRNRVQSGVNVPLPATLAFDFPTVAALGRHLASVLKLELTAPISRSDDASADDEIAALTDDEAEALLRDELELLQQIRRGK